MTSVLLFTVSDWVLWGQVTVCIVIYCFRLGIVESCDVCSVIYCFKLVLWSQVTVCILVIYCFRLCIVVPGDACIVIYCFRLGIVESGDCVYWIRGDITRTGGGHFLPRLRYLQNPNLSLNDGNISSNNRYNTLLTILLFYSWTILLYNVERP